MAVSDAFGPTMMPLILAELFFLFAGAAN